MRTVVWRLLSGCDCLGSAATFEIDVRSKDSRFVETTPPDLKLYFCRELVEVGEVDVSGKADLTQLRYLQRRK